MENNKMQRMAKNAIKYYENKEDKSEIDIVYTTVLSEYIKYLEEVLHEYDKAFENIKNLM